MIVGGPITVHARWLTSGDLFLWGSRGQNGFVDATELKHMLFAWHAPSFYGTLIDTVEQNLKEGVRLPVLESLAYFCDSEPARHALLQWGDELAELRQMAKNVREMLSAGRFMPDYTKWKAGKPGWKLELPDEAGELSPFTREWMDAVVTQTVREDDELREVLDRLDRAFPLVQQGVLPKEVWLDEDDWLISIGWRRDSSPFRTCLQLLEPEQEQTEWRLQIVLQDRSQPERLHICSPEGCTAADLELLPAEWQAEAGRIQRDTERWITIVPLLASPAEPGMLRQALSTDEAWEFLSLGSIRLAEAGCTVFLPAWWERIRRLKPRLRAKIRSAAGAAPEAAFGLSQIVQFDWRLAIGDLELTEGEFRDLIEQKRRLVQFRGRWIQLDPGQLAQIQQAMKKINKKKGLSFRDVLELYLLGQTNAEPSEIGGDPERADASAEPSLQEEIQLEVELNDHLRGFIRQLEQHAGIPPLPPPESFHGTLRHYQTEGVSWLMFLRSFGLGGCLADDMGLGKTVQWITYLLHVKENEPGGAPALLICPTSVLGNWEKELGRFAPSLKVHLHYGPQRLKSGDFTAAATQTDIVLTTYTLAHLDEQELASVAWDSVCLDEAQNIKNAYTKQAAAIRRLPGFHRIALTGTPIENRLTELWSIFDFINPGYLGSLREFSQRFAHAVERTKDPAAVAAMQRLVKPFLLRRVKKDPAIQLDLPEKYEYKTYVSLTPEQASLYENCIQDMFERLDRLSAMERRGMILSVLTKLKQVCNHPALLLKEPPTADSRTAARSGKAERLLDMVAELRQEGDCCLIFTQFVESGLLLQRLLERHLGENVPFMHGGTPRAAREALVQRFQDESLPAEERFGVFILSLKAGGIGLNLTAANHVFHFDRWWNPAVENQATDRAFRIGQTRDVQVHKFVTLGTLEEKIDEMIERKMILSKEIIGGGENWITELSNEDLRDLFALRRSWLER